MSLISDIEYINSLHNQSFQNFQNLQNQPLQNTAFGISPNMMITNQGSQKAYLNAQAYYDQYRNVAHQYTDNAYKKKILSQEQRLRQWYNWYEEKGYGVYDANYDVVRLTTGEVLTHRAWEDGLRPPVSNENWLDDQINFVTQKAYSKTNLFSIKR